ncbi:MAG: hypothetical protein JXR58_09745 [Bacteroidales bacterium]|nr:hypothetical protein [Bacteroidales bacterium]
MNQKLEGILKIKFRLIIKLLFVTLILSSIYSCKKEKPDPIQTYKKQDGVFICNEGNFTFGNATLSFFDPNKKEIFNQVFINANSFPVGDILQSVSVFEKKAYLLVNNSGKILIINADDFTHQGTISGLVSPRYMVFVNSEKAFVSDLYSKSISIINPTTLEITGNINIGCSSEQMIIIDDYLYVTSWSYNNKLFKININNHSITDSLDLQMQPNSLVKDKNNKLWVLCDGGIDGQAGLSKINPANMDIEKNFLFSGTQNSPTELKINGSGDSLFYINSSWNTSQSISGNGICIMSIEDESLPTSTIIPEQNRLFFALGIDPISSIVYISDAKDFMQKGWIFRYKPSGEIIDSFKVDIVPGDFCFKTK